MQRTFRLTVSEVGKVEFSCRLICDRQDWRGAPLQEMYESTARSGFCRHDMYWIECHLDGEDLGSFCVDPSPTDVEAFTVNRNYNRVEGQEGTILKQCAADWFKTTPEYENQVRWMQSIVDDLYTPHGGYAAYSEKCRIVASEHLQKKIAVAKKYDHMFANIDQVPSNRDALVSELDNCLKTEGVYRTWFGIATFMHMQWVWSTYVKGKSQAA